MQVRDALLELRLLFTQTSLAGAMQSFEQLKTHCSKLESTIASLESANVQVTSQTQQEALARERDVDELRSRVKTLETALHKEKHLNKDRKSVV